MLVALLAFVSIGAQKLSATVVVVGNCMSGVTFSTIQAAVNAVPPGLTIRVCPGSYPEQVVINKPLTLAGVTSGTSGAAVIVSPVGGLVQNATSYFGSPIAAQIFIQGTTSSSPTVNLTDLVVDGYGNNVSGCSPNIVGIFYQDASGTVNHVTTTNQAIDVQPDGCQLGLGIFAQSDDIGGTSNVTVENSSVHNYQKNGITGNEIGTTINVLNNNVVGYGPTTGAAQNGIQIGFGATGRVTGNTVNDDIWVGTGWAASGILLYDAANSITISQNTVGSAQFGIALASDGTPGTPTDDAEIITSNKISGSQGDSIDACTNGNSIRSNTIMDSGESAIHLDDECSSTDSGGTTGNNNSAIQNTIVDACAGILLGSGTGNTFAPNAYYTTANTTLAGDLCSLPPSQHKPAGKRRARGAAAYRAARP